MCFSGVAFRLLKLEDFIEDIMDKNKYLNILKNNLLQSAVQMGTPQGAAGRMCLLQCGISGPEVPELSSHRTPVVMFCRSGGLA